MSAPTGARPFDLVVLTIGVLAVSTAAVFIREADAPSIVIAASRMLLATAPFLLVAAVRGDRLVPAGPPARWLTLGTGLLLAIHFAVWIKSVQETSVVTSVVLVTTAPLFVAIASGPLLGEPPTRNVWIGLAIAAVGTLVMVSEDFGAGGDTLLGDLYALIGAVCAAGMFLAGRQVLSAGAGWFPFSTAIYAIAALVLAALVLLSGETFSGYSDKTYLYLLLLALVPQVIGHTALNRTLGHMPAFAVSLAVMGEPVGATILAALVLDETPTAIQLAGGLLVLAGVYAGLKQSTAPATLEI
jgi:drug/metabolite transporter (DMT)-like permease